MHKAPAQWCQCYGHQEVQYCRFKQKYGRQDVDESVHFGYMLLLQTVFRLKYSFPMRK